MSVSLTYPAKSQQWQSLISLDSRIGYSTNTYLNSYINEWDRSVDSGFGAVSVSDQSFWYKNNNSLLLSGGLVYEPFLNVGDAWKGAYGYADYSYRITQRFSAGLRGGGSYYSAAYERASTWLHPQLTWFISPFTQFEINAGVNFRHYDYRDSTAATHRYDTYGMRFETWPTYHWRLAADLYGGLDVLPDINKGFSGGVSAQYTFNNGASVNAGAGIEQYQYQYQASLDGNASAGGAEVSEPVKDTNRMYRLSLQGAYPINNRVSLFSNAAYLRSDFKSFGGSTNDIKVSAGIRLNFYPHKKSRSNVIEPKWTANEETHIIRVRYSGEGQLYLVGDFNNWERPGIPLRRESKNTYLARVKVTTGVYSYRVLRITGEDEDWLKFSGNTYTTDDDFGGENALLLVE